MTWTAARPRSSPSMVDHRRAEEVLVRVEPPQRPSPLGNEIRAGDVVGLGAGQRPVVAPHGAGQAAGHAVPVVVVEGQGEPGEQVRYGVNATLPSDGAAITQPSQPRMCPMASLT
jgi:hypothetical protein